MCALPQPSCPDAMPVPPGSPYAGWLPRLRAGGYGSRHTGCTDSLVDTGRYCAFGHLQCIEIQHVRLQRHDILAVGAPAHRLQRRATDHMLQLAHIARPAVAAQGLFGRSRKPQAAQTQPCPVEFQKAPGQQQHVVALLAQRRDRNRIHRQPVVQVRTKRSVAHMLAQTSVGGRDHAHVHPPRPVGPKALDLAVLQRAQQLGLDGQWQLTHFVQEQRAALCRLETTGPVVHRAGKCSARMAEQFALRQ